MPLCDTIVGRTDLATKRAMPAQTEIERRGRALLAFTIPTGARDDAIVSCRLKHIDFANRQFEPDARDVQTKRSKTFMTWYCPVGDDIERIVREWVGSRALGG